MTDSLELELSVLGPTFAICQLDSMSPVPNWATRGWFHAIVRTASELSVVCPQADVPPGTTCEGGWRCLRVSGPLDLSLVGVLSSLAAPLAQAGISIFAISTYDTDYVMVKEQDMARCMLAVAQAGHRVNRDASPPPPDDLGKEIRDE